MRREIFLFLVACIAALLSARWEISPLILVVLSLLLTFYIKFRLEDLGVVTLSGLFLAVGSSDLPAVSSSNLLSYLLFLLILYDLWVGERRWFSSLMVIQLALSSGGSFAASDLVTVFFGMLLIVFFVTPSFAQGFGRAIPAWSGRTGGSVPLRPAVASREGGPRPKIDAALLFAFLMTETFWILSITPLPPVGIGVAFSAAYAFAYHRFFEVEPNGGKPRDIAPS